jgi:hypothetical protein
MEIGSIFLILAIVLAVGLYVAQPFLERRGRKMTTEAHEVSSLMAERDRVINSLQELDFDYNLNKIPAGEYPAQRAELLKKGADILKKLDAMLPSSDGKESAADRVESAVAARRADTSTAQPSPRDDDHVEALIASRRSARKEKSGGFCPRCGKPVLVSDRFCPHCGKSIA